MLALGSGCAAWTAGVDCGDCGTCRPGPIRTVVGTIRNLEIPCGIAIPHPSWARNHREKPTSVPQAEILQVRGRFHAVPTRPVFAPKHPIVMDRGEPTPAQAAPEVPLPAPRPHPLSPRQPGAAPPIPMMAPPDRSSAAAETESDAVSLAVEVVEAEAIAPEEGPEIQPAVSLRTRPLQQPWRGRPTAR